MPFHPSHGSLEGSRDSDLLCVHTLLHSLSLSLFLFLFLNKPGVVLIINKQVVPSGPKKAPHWAQKKCSGCQVLSKAVTTFCETKERICASEGWGCKRVVKVGVSSCSTHRWIMYMCHYGTKQQHIRQSEAMRGQAKSTETVWEVLERCDG